MNPFEADWVELVPTIQKHWEPAETNVVSFTEWLASLQRLEPPGPERFPALKLLDFFVGYAAEAAHPREESLRFETKNCTNSSDTMATILSTNQPGGN